MQQAPGLPCALCFREGKRRCKPRAHRAARVRNCIRRHCERSEAIRWPLSRRYGLLRCAGIVRGRNYRCRTWADDVAFCNAANFGTAPANGQWQFGRLLCIGAAGIQASEPRRSRSAKIRGRKHAEIDFGCGIDRGFGSGRARPRRRRRSSSSSATWWRPNTPKGKGAEKFKELAEKYTNGKVKVEVYPNSQLYKDKEELEALQLGAVQMLAPSTRKFGPLGVKEFEVFDLPYILPDLAALRKVTDGPLGKALLKLLEPRA